MLTFHDLPLRVRLAGLDDLVPGREQLEAVGLAAVRHVADPGEQKGFRDRRCLVEKERPVFGQGDKVQHRLVRPQEVQQIRHVYSPLCQSAKSLYSSSCFSDFYCLTSIYIYPANPLVFEWTAVLIQR